MTWVQHARRAASPYPCASTPTTLCTGKKWFAAFAGEAVERDVLSCLVATRACPGDTSCPTKSFEDGEVASR